MATATNRNLGPREIMQDALGRILQATKMQAGAGYLLHPEGSGEDVLDLAAQQGLGPALAEIIAQLPVLFVQGANARGEPTVWVIEGCPDPSLRRGFAAHGFRMGINIPLRAGDHLVGVMVVAARRARRVACQELSLLAAIGQQIALEIENARLHDAEQDRWAESERRRRVAEALRDILAKLNSDEALEETLAAIAEQASDLLACDAIAIFRLDRTAGLLVPQATRGLDEDYAETLRVPVGKGAAGQAIARGQPVVIPDAMAILDDVRTWSDDPRWPRLAEEDTQDYRALFAVPLFVRGDLYGAITLAYHKPRAFAQEEIDLAVSFGNQVALAVENASLRQRAGEAAVLTERGRLARELHDSVTQGLYSVTLNAEAALRLLAEGRPDEAARQIRKAAETAYDSLREMRLLIFELRPLELEKYGLAGALRTRLESVENRGGIKAELQVQGEAVDLPLRLQEDLYQVAREALNNILKHAQAHHVDVRLRVTRTDCLLEVEDDGVGFDTGVMRMSGGMGLRGMRERAEKLGADLKVDSVPGKGTCLRLRVARPGAGV